MYLYLPLFFFQDKQITKKIIHITSTYERRKFLIIIGLFCDALEFWPKMKNLLFCHSTRYLNSNYNAGSAKCSTNSLFILLKEIWRYKNGSPLTVNHKRPDIGIGKRTIQLYIKHYTETKVLGHNNSTKKPWEELRISILSAVKIGLYFDTNCC